MLHIFISPRRRFSIKKKAGVRFSPLFRGGELKQNLRFSLQVVAILLFLRFFDVDVSHFLIDIFFHLLSGPMSTLPPRASRSSWSSPCRAPRFHVDGLFDRKKSVVMEKSLKEWGQDPNLLVDLVLSKRLQMHRKESSDEVIDIVPQPISFAPMAILALNEVPYMLCWGGFPVFQCWIVGVIYVPLMLVPASISASDLDVRVYSQI